MPELPEVEVVKQSLEKYILNESLLKIVIKNKKLRFPIPINLSKKLSKKNIVNVKRFLLRLHKILNTSHIAIVLNVGGVMAQHLEVLLR